MRTVYVDYETRSIADLVRPGELTTGWTITRINVPENHRGKGNGTRLLEHILEDADKEAVTLWLEVSPSDGLDREQLVAWYRRHGFTGQPGDYMTRLPRTYERWPDD